MIHGFPIAHAETFATIDVHAGQGVRTPSTLGPFTVRLHPDLTPPCSPPLEPEGLCLSRACFWAALFAAWRNR